MVKVVNLRNARYDVYIGRAGKGKDGYFGNPVAVGRHCPECKKIHRKGGETIPCYTAYFMRRIRNDEEFLRRVLELRGKTLGCFCKPAACHGDVIKQFLDLL